MLKCPSPFALQVWQQAGRGNTDCRQNTHGGVNSVRISLGVSLLAQSGPRKALCRGVLPTACVKNVQLTPSPPHPTPPHQSPPASRLAVTRRHRPCGRGRLGPGRPRAHGQCDAASRAGGWCWICEGARCARGSSLHRLRRFPSPASGRGSAVALFCLDPPLRSGERICCGAISPLGVLSRLRGRGTTQRVVEGVRRPPMPGLRADLHHRINRHR
jgi:hypothetical protein